MRILRNLFQSPKIQAVQPLAPQQQPSEPDRPKGWETSPSNRIAPSLTTGLGTFRQKTDSAFIQRALRAAENWDRADRSLLALLYHKVREDAHMSGLLLQRASEVTTQTFCVAKKGEEDPAAMQVFKGLWFRKFVEACLDVRMEGTVLVELGEVMGGKLQGITRIPYHYFDPVRGLIYKTGEPNLQTGMAYRKEEYATTLIELGEPYDLGDLRKAAYYLVVKMFAIGNWATYTDIFGIPPMAVRTESQDPVKRGDYLNMLTRMRSAFGMVVDKDDELQMLADSRNGSQVYDQLVDRCNKEMSKLVLGQTMTSEAGSSEAQARIHQQVAHAIEEQELQYIEWVVNAELIPRLIALKVLPAGEYHYYYPRQQELQPNQLQQLGAEFLGRLDIPAMAYRWNLKLKEEPYTMPKANELGAAGLSGLLQLQQQVSAGIIPRDAGVATLVNIFGLDTATAQALLPASTPVRPALTSTTPPAASASATQLGVNFLPS